ncbi:HPr family phosphocarrier protein [Natroniella acetigena]|uniref:HPr family phosphocarrier protein n=1 Tax=Natroniella acetigena TaxID=52004 RepID=UPI00200A3F03|nr:HPr family phosphocarrier protein [Natroniella acetigena]MCK8827005.1 HPr family phosphocarrier protein [Natroniella acetigena]
MLTKEVTIIDKIGLHLRPASVLVAIANQFESEIIVVRDNQEANLKSIISVMNLAVGCGEKIEIQVRGKDAKEALAKIEEVIANGFETEGLAGKKPKKMSEKLDIYSKNNKE